MAKIYCAGPLFNDAERAEMAEIARGLEAEGHETYLPQRDGLEAKELIESIRGSSESDEKAVSVHEHAIFCLDVFRLLSWADVVVANLNGRVPDEGTVVECALAWSAEKPLVLFKKDMRGPFDGRDNPMLTRLTRGDVVGDFSEIPKAVERQLGGRVSDPPSEEIRIGKQIAELQEAKPSQRLLGEQLVRVVGSALGESRGK